MSTSDMHGHLLPYDYFRDQPAPQFGLSQTAVLISRYRRGANLALLLDNGDFLQGTPLADLAALTPERPHPAIAVMNSLKYDAASLGNHEFNYGLDFLNTVTKQADFPLLSANIGLSGGAGEDSFRPAFRGTALLHRHIKVKGKSVPICIGVIGLSPPQIVSWDRHQLPGDIMARDIVECAAEIIPLLRQQGAEIVIALAHTGIGQARHHRGMENAAVPLAALPGLDAIVSGHTHQIFPGPQFSRTPEIDPVAGQIHGCPVVMPGAFGSHLGIIDLPLHHDGRTWNVLSGARVLAAPVMANDAGHQARCRVVTDASVARQVEADHKSTLRRIRRPIGTTATHLHNYFSLVAADPTLTFVAQAQASAIREALKGRAEASLPLVSVVAPCRAGGMSGPGAYVDIPPGPVMLRHATALYPFPNCRCAMKLTGAILREWIEQSASAYAQIVPGSRDQNLMRPDIPAYFVDQFFGLNYQIDLSQPARYDIGGEIAQPSARRIIDLTHAGQDVADDQEFVVALNSYRAGGGGDVHVLAGRPLLVDLKRSLRDIIVRALVEGQTPSPPINPVWRFRSMPGTRVAFATSAEAKCHLREPQLAGLEHLSSSDDGFHLYGLTL